MTIARIAFAFVVGAMVIAVVASLVTAERRKRAERSEDGAIQFEARSKPRRVLSVVWGALAVGVLASVAIRPDVFQTIAAVALGLLAVREWNQLALRVSDRAITHHPPNWMVTPSNAGGVALGGIIEANDVAGIEWIGHDNIGIRRKDGAIESVFFRHRITRERQDEARAAVLGFVERACGSVEPREQPIASWVGQRVSA